MYEPISYWKEAGKTYINYYIHNHVYKNQERELKRLLRTFGFKSVLELGCGFGRLTNFILDRFDVDSYVALDVSPHQLSHIKPRPNLELVNTDILSFHTDKKFDLIVSAEVLMHQLPEQMPAIVAKMKSLARHIINIDYYVDEDVELVDFNFKHDYPKLYGRCISIQIDRQALFHYSSW